MFLAQCRWQATTRIAQNCTLIIEGDKEISQLCIKLSEAELSSSSLPDEKVSPTAFSAYCDGSCTPLLHGQPACSSQAVQAQLPLL